MPIAARWASGSRTNTSPQSYGTLSHLCASVDHESAPSCPAIRWRSDGTAAAHSPNAPSMWTQASGRSSRTIAMAAASGSKAPLFTLPAWRQTIVGPLARPRFARNASRRMRPSWSAATRSGACSPNPSSRRPAKTVTCASSPMTTETRGPPCRPSASTSHPTRRRTASRAAASAVKLAIVAPVVKPTDVPRGRPNRSTSQWPATVSIGRGGRRGDRRRRVLVPHAGQPVRRDGRGQAAPDHEAEEAGPGHRHQPGRDLAREIAR